YHHSSPGLPEFTTVTRVPVLTGATVDEFAAIGAAVPARASPGPATPTAARGLTQQQVYEAAGVSKSSYRGHAEIRGKFTHFPSIHMINITILKNHMGIAMRRF
ncbi:TPA: hypothetical protein ACID7Z_006361, partial [Pseudomonas aeruginosa]|nr:hypothetical protein [Pseudomonas aeruginosa]